MELIIDGYNILFRLARLESFKLTSQKNFHIERENFIRVLLNKEELKDYRIIVIFDGQEQETRAESKKSLLVIYTAKEETADDLILKLVRQKKVTVTINGQVLKIVLGKEITIVTDDTKLRQRLEETKRMEETNSDLKIKEADWLNLG